MSPIEWWAAVASISGLPVGILGATLAYLAMRQAIDASKAAREARDAMQRIRAAFDMAAAPRLLSTMMVAIHDRDFREALRACIELKNVVLAVYGLSAARPEAREGIEGAIRELDELEQGLLIASYRAELREEDLLRLGRALQRAQRWVINVAGALRLWLEEQGQGDERE